MVRIGIVAEGKSEWLVLEAIVRTLLDDAEFERIRPDMTLATGSPHGWRGVKAWCTENGPRLEVILQGVTSNPLDLLIVHADCSMAHNEDALMDCPPASDTAAALRDVIVRKWLGRLACPEFVIVTNPSRSTEAWIVSALNPPYEHLGNVECEDAEEELVRRHLLRRKDGEVKKQEVRYKPLAVLAAGRLDVVRQHCTQADLFCNEFAAAVAKLP